MAINSSKKTVVHFTDEFKQNAVKFYKTNSYTLRQAAKQLNITCGTLSKWLKKYNESVTLATQNTDEKIEILQHEIEELRSSVNSLRNIITKLVLEKYNRVDG